MLSDIRLDGKHKRVIDAFKQQYKLHFNSTKSKRGVGILISNRLDLDVISTYSDPDENILLLHCNISGKKINIGSIYGPNNDDDTFFLTLEQVSGHYHHQN